MSFCWDDLTSEQVRVLEELGIGPGVLAYFKKRRDLDDAVLAAVVEEKLAAGLSVRKASAAIAAQFQRQPDTVRHRIAKLRRTTFH